jgi:beta-lactamase regulating signal transducer with metallopeptidase domain
MVGAPIVAAALAAIICRCLHRASAATRHWIWWLAMVMIATCFVVAVFRWRVALPVLPRSTASLVGPIPPVSVTQVASVEKTPPVTLVVLIRIWQLGVLALLLRSAMGILRLQTIIRRSRPLDADGWQTLRTSMDRPKQKGVRHLVSSEISIPMVEGIRRPVVLLPESALTWPRHLLRAVLIHEHAHLKRRDLAMLAFARFVTFLHWMNPAAWYALRRMQADAEMAADDCVVVSDGEPVAYAEGLVELVRLLKRSAASRLPAIGMLRRGGSIHARVARILDPQCHRLPPRAQLRWATAAVVVVLTGGLVGIRLVAALPIPVRVEAMRTKPDMPAAFEPAPFTLDSPYPAPSNEDPRFRAEKLIYYANGYVLESVHPPGTDGFRVDLQVGPVSYEYSVTVARAAPRTDSHFNFNGDFPGPGYRELKHMPVRQRLSPAKGTSSVL